MKVKLNIDYHYRGKLYREGEILDVTDDVIDWLFAEKYAVPYQEQKQVVTNTKIKKDVDEHPENE